MLPMTMVLRRYSDTSSSCAAAILLLLAWSEACSCTTHTFWNQLLQHPGCCTVFTNSPAGGIHAEQGAPWQDKVTIDTEALKITGP